MAKQRLFPKRQNDDKRSPREQFDSLASRLFTIPKADIDQREKQWQQQRKKPKRVS
jgi:hypothetical protein